MPRHTERSGQFRPLSETRPNETEKGADPRPKDREDFGNGDSNQVSARGFASMDKGKQREIASKGGKAAHKKGSAHEFTTEGARIAGRKGGVSVSKNREHMAAIGKKGGEARAEKRKARMVNTSSDHPRGGGESYRLPASLAGGKNG